MTDNQASGNPYIDSVAGSWKTNIDVSGRYIVTYAFADNRSEAGVAEPRSFAALTPEWRSEVDVALGFFSAVSNISFVRLAYDPNATAEKQITPRLDIYAFPTGGGTSYFQGSERGGNVVFAWDPTLNPNPMPGQWSVHDYLHELGHALGLQHPDEIGALKPGMPQDHWAVDYTNMFAGPALVSGTVGSLPTYLQGLGMDDIRAVQFDFGANFDTNSGDTVYTWDSNGDEYVNGVKQTPHETKIFFGVIWDGGGNDTYDFSNFTSNLQVDLRPGNWSTFDAPFPQQNSFYGANEPGTLTPGNLGNAYLYHGDTRSLIENATGGSGNDLLIGNQIANVLTGNAGNDTLDGGVGADTMRGGTGDDTYYVDNPDDVVTELAGEGSDTVISSIAYSLKNRPTIEGLTLIGSFVLVDGNDAANILTGNAADNIINGYAGNDTLYGVDGNDTLDGGDGNDMLDGGSGNDQLLGGAGNDTLHGVDGNDTLDGGDGNDFLDGGSGDDQLLSGAGNDTLDGGAGDDTLQGGAGDDVYLFGFGSGNDKIILGDGGLDVLQFKAGVNASDVTWAQQGDNFVATLRGGADTLTLFNWFKYVTNTLTVSFIDGQSATISQTQIGSSGSERLVGGSQNSILYGLAGNDTLIGGAGDDILDGGAGADQMTGGAGNDSYYVDNVGDAIFENANEGTDTVYSSITYSLSTSPNLENLTLIGSGNINATGNSGINVIKGNDSDNIIDGAGGADQMMGAKGNDTYYVRSANDRVVENPNEGTDTILTFIDKYILADNVENLILQTGMITGTGNASDNVITGNASNNILYGLDGNDNLIGLDGNDTIDGGNGDDTIDGGAGNDYILGRAGNNTYYFGFGDGTDLIDTYGSTTDKIIFKKSVTANDMAFSFDTNGWLVITLSDHSVVTVRSSYWAKNPELANLTLFLSDGTQVFQPHANQFVPTVSGSGVVNGTAGNDSMLGSSGADSMYGGDGNDYLVGGAGNDVLYGGAGKNTLDGGLGADTMNGFGGQSVFYVDNPGDVVQAAPDIIGSDGKPVSAGDDTVISTIDFSLENLRYVENLQLIGNQVTVRGNSLNNNLIGNDANNIFYGNGGYDVMTGGKGDDVYYIEVGKIVEKANEGYDIVYATGDIWLFDTEVEELHLVDSDTSKAVWGVGNELDNIITGNRLNNSIDGAAGADTMTGGLGDDTYYVENKGDRVIEYANEGTDRVYSWLDSYTLPGNVENLYLVDPAVTGIGNELANYLHGTDLDNVFYGLSGDDTIVGSFGDDTLDGGMGNDVLDGGTGADKLIGGGGSDTASYADAEAGVTVDFANPLNNTGDAKGDTYASGLPVFSSSEMAHVKVADFAIGAGGWVNNTRYPRQLVDVNHDGKLDVVGFGEAHVFVALGNGDGSFGPQTVIAGLDGYTPVGGGWNSNDRYPRMFADLNGDGRLDVIGFGESQVFVSMANADGSFGPMKGNVGLDGYTPQAGGWNSNTEFPRLLGDVNGDGKIDVVAFGWQHVFVSYGNGDGTFGSMQTGSGLDGFTPAGGGWNSNDQFPRMLADVNGDGALDVVGFGWAHVFVSLGNVGSNGKADGTFQPMASVLDDFAVAAGGWVNETTYPRFVKDMNGDGMADLVGFGEGGVYVALATGGGHFAAPEMVFDNFGHGGAAGGWASQDMYPRLLGDLNGDGSTDIVGFGQAGIYTALGAADVIENLTGSAFNDKLSGNGLANVITGGAGADTLTGGGGADTFVFTALTDSTLAAPDTITDFVSGQDHIDLSLIDASSRTSGDQPFHYVGASAFSGVAGELNYVNGVVSGDVNGDKVADFQILLGNKAALISADFIL